MVVVVAPEGGVAAARADCTVAACIKAMTVIMAIGAIATSAMRVRMAPPFVGRVGRAFLCSVLAGSGHCIRSPDGEREGIVRPGFAP